MKITHHTVFNMDNRREIYGLMMGVFDPSIRSRGEAIDFIYPILACGVVPGAIHS